MDKKMSKTLVKTFILYKFHLIWNYFYSDEEHIHLISRILIKSNRFCLFPNRPVQRPSKYMILTHIVMLHFYQAFLINVSNLLIKFCNSLYIIYT